MATTKHTEDITTTSPKIVISFEKKVGKPNYGNESAFISLEVDAPIGASPEECMGLAHAAFGFVKAQVYKQLGLIYGTDDATGIIVPVEAAVENPPQAQAPARREAPPAPSRPASKPQADGERIGWGEYFKNPQDFYDNRATKTGRQPDFKHKRTGQAFWLSSAPDWVKEKFAAMDEEPF